MFLTILLILLTCIISYLGMKNEAFLQKYAFNVGKIRFGNEYYRLFSSGFLHISWIHLIINMVVLYAFGSGLEIVKGTFPFLLLFFAGLAGGNLVALQVHKYQTAYTSVGASGAISGIVFATIGLFPHTQFFFIPAWIFGILYIALTLYAIRINRTDVGHAAHLGGGLSGFILAIIIFPNDLLHNWIPVLAVLLPGLILLFLIIRYPHLIMIDRKTRKKQLSMEDHYHIQRRTREQETDRILEKINRTGMKSLTDKEKKFLEDQSHH